MITALALLEQALPYAEFEDKWIHFDDVSLQHWRLEIRIPVPPGAVDHTPEACLKALLEAPDVSEL